MKIAIIGGGAAGFFSALSAKAHHPSSHVTIYEKSGKLLSKVKISGGGRCNVTNAETRIGELTKAYPRGSKLLKKAFHEFSTQDTIKWFESRDVKLKAEADGRVFPVTDSSQTIIECLLREAGKSNIEILTNTPVDAITVTGECFELKGKTINTTADKVIIASGGSPKKEGLQWLANLGHAISDPVPSLFTFNMPKNDITNLMGLVCENASLSIQRTKLKSSGPLLITHWGMSGPAVLKLSAFGARELANLNYQFQAQVNWTGGLNDSEVANKLGEIIETNPHKQLGNFRPFELPDRLWQFLISKTDLPPDKKWNELGKKGLNKLTSILTNDIYSVSGKTTFKEEFVTCGGVSLSSIHSKSLESTVCSGLYFAGEILDIDGITGGYNFQAAWTTGFIAGQLRKSK